MFRSRVLTTFFTFQALTLFCLAGPATAEEETTIRTLTSEQVENYQFQTDKTPYTVKPLTIGQQAILENQRRLARDLTARKLGILSFKASKQDLVTLQQLVDKKLIRSHDTEAWQGVGILFGDILVKQFGLKWISYEDERGVNKALQYRDSENFVFPVTLFSKRVKFGEEIDMTSLFGQLEQEIDEFKRLEYKPRLPNSNKSS